MLQGAEAKTIPDWAKAAVFNHIREQAAQVGWEYNPDAREFYSPDAREFYNPDAGDAIPF